MIDTIVLLLDQDAYTITEPDKFEPSARWLLNNSTTIKGLTAKQNPTKKELLNGIYKPHLTLMYSNNIKQFNSIVLKIELSLPKLFFGNNFDELQYKNFSALIKKLTEILNDMGVKITTPALTLAPVSAIHYSKNIPLTDGSTPYHFINKIKASNIKLSLDVNQTDYRNDGHSFKWHCNSYEVIFYDKIKDLEKAKQGNKRALEKDSYIQMNLFEMLEKRNKLEILRMEVRLNKRQKIKQFFSKLGISSDLTFKKLFKPAISKKILLHYFDELESKRSALVDYKTKNDKTLLVDLVVNNSDLGIKQILQLFGLKKVLEVVNLRELRSMFSKYNQRNWYRLMRDLNKVQLPNSQDSIGLIKKHLIKYKPLKIQDYEKNIPFTR